MIKPVQHVHLGIPSHYYECALIYAVIKQKLYCQRQFCAACPKHIDSYKIVQIARASTEEHHSLLSQCKQTSVQDLVLF